MTIRETIEQTEKNTLSAFATLNTASKGRPREEEQCDIRPLFQRDRDRILHSKAFRRLKNKTQVFLSPEGDHYRTRLSHTLEVSQNARTIAKALRLNEDLVEAIALGHDLGHTPYGHAGESVLNELCEDGFEHCEQSVRVLQRLENDGQGLNLTWEVIDGIRNHRTSSMPATPEGQIVRFADKIAYIHSDIDDAIRAHILHEEDIPASIRKALGKTVKDRLDHVIHDVITQSEGSPIINMSSEVKGALTELRAFLFEHVYRNPIAKSEEVKAKLMVRELYGYYDTHVNELPPRFLAMIEQENERKDRVICDYISGMTDSYANKKFCEYFVPLAWDGGE